ncbi:hypothetical protein JXB41_00875 [Candidatus Woesearchaeota archaeon]|nr:hypothetical protein [Candidatus Woesearchaeota archaeon]
MKKRVLILLALFSVLLFSCSKSFDPIKFAKANSQVKEFLKEYPNAEMKLILLTEEQVNDSIEEIREGCGEQMLVSSYYKITIDDPDSNLNLVMYIDSESNTLNCIYRKTVRTCEDECTDDTCEGYNYIECIASAEGCKVKEDKGPTMGKCSVECINDDDCEGDDRCIDYNCLFLDCEDECTEDTCSGYNYISCLRGPSMCKEKKDEGPTIGKCDVECEEEDDCDSDERCNSKYKCTEDICEDECTGDACDDYNYIECILEDDGCKHKVNKGIILGKCNVECFENGHCSEDEACSDYECTCDYDALELPDGYSDENNVIDFDFIDDKPPDQVGDNGGDEFEIAVLIENNGEAEIEEGYLEIIGINATEFDISPGDLTEDFSSVDPGDEEEIEIDDLNYQEDLTDNIEVGITANLCFGYKTKSIIRLCVNKHDCKTCNVDQENEYHNSGAPIHITDVEQQLEDDDTIELSFRIENVDSDEGAFFARNTDCNDTSSNEDRYKVWIDIDSDMDIGIECSDIEDDDDTGLVYISNGESEKIDCEIDISDVDDVLEDWLYIKMEYMYLKDIDIEVDIMDED